MGLRYLINEQQFPTFSTSLIRDLDGFSKFKTLKGQFTRVKNQLNAQIDNMITNPEKDPIFRSFFNLIGDSSVTIIPYSAELIKKAQVRKLKGNPPSDEKEIKIGDEIIWESILMYVKDDLIIVTRDLTYSSHTTFLKNEYKEKNGKSLLFSKKISDALKLVGKDASPELKQFEKEQQKISTLPLGQFSPLGSLGTSTLGAGLANQVKMMPINALGSLGTATLGACLYEQVKTGQLRVVGAANVIDKVKDGQQSSKPKQRGKNNMHPTFRRSKFKNNIFHKAAPANQVFSSNLQIN